MHFDNSDPFVTGLYNYTFNINDVCHDTTNNNTCLFCDRNKFQISYGLSSRASHLYIGCNPLRTTDGQNESLARTYNLERGLITDSHSGGVLYEFISKINYDFQEAIEKLAVQSKRDIFSAASKFETIVFDSQVQAFKRTQSNYENPLSTVLNVFREALDRKERNDSVTVFGIPGDLPKSEIEQMFDRICSALQINYKINVNLEKIKNMLIYKFCCRRHRDHFFYNFQVTKLTGSCIGLVSNGNLHCFENMASKMYNLSREIHDRHQRKEIKKYLRHQGLIYVWLNNNNTNNSSSNTKHPKLFYFMEELNVKKENVIRLLNNKILFSKIVQKVFPEKVESVVNMRHSKYIQSYLRPEICVKYYPVSSIVDYIAQEENYKKEGLIFNNIVTAQILWVYRSREQNLLLK